ncbi:glycine-rich domain-containing protein-like [Kocuria palustris]|nr:glycine-rich domain-containing protein-like [Kocuria palustris]
MSLASELYYRRNLSGAVSLKNYFPTTDEVRWHLKFVKALDKYKRTILNSDRSLPGDIWRVFLIYALRRFIVFMLACFREYNHQPGKVNEEKNFEHGFKLSPQFLQFMSRLVPPLDVAMVWYSYLMDLGAWYDRGIRGDFMNFINFPFPLQAIAQAIDDDTYDYNPQPQDVQYYQQVLTNFSQDEPERIYHVPSITVIPESVFVWCPNCGENILPSVPWTNDDLTGFADADFVAQKAPNLSCRCPFSPMITHDELRKRTLYYFIKNNLFLPGLFKHFSEVFHSYKKVESLQADINKTLSSDRLLRNMPNMLFSEFVWGVRQKCRLSDFAQKMDLIMAPLANTNIVFTTGSNTLTFTEDFVQMVRNCEPFFEKLTQLNWAEDKYQTLLIDELIKRYREWLPVSRATKGQAIFPTVDIDLIWRTHQLAPFFYFNFMKEEMKYMLDESFVAQNARQVYEYTLVQYKGVAGHDLSICKCNACVRTRHGMGDELLLQAMGSMSLSEKLNFNNMSEKERMAQHYAQQEQQGSSKGQTGYSHSETRGLPPSYPDDNYAPPPGHPPKQNYAPPPGPPPKQDYAPPPGPPPQDDFAPPPGPPPQDDFAPPPGPPPQDDFAPPPGPPPEKGGNSSLASRGQQPIGGGGASQNSSAPPLPPGYANASASGKAGVWLALSPTYPQKCDAVHQVCECRGSMGCGGGGPSCRAARLNVGEGGKLGLFGRIRRS